MLGATRFRSTRQRGPDIVHRWEGNPLIGLGDLHFKCSGIHNAGAVCFKDEPLLLVTVENLAGQRCIHIARPTVNERYEVDHEPFLSPSQEQKYKQHESHGVLDGRVTLLDGVHYIVYNALGNHGYRLGLAKTEDFVSAERIGLISEPDTKAGTLLPERIKGRYARLERPQEGNSIWVTYSDDLTYWGGSEVVISPRGGFWDESRIGLGPPPIETSQGWLVLYYGAKDTSAGPIYRIGTVILDREEPTRVIARANIPILSPRENYERIGDIPNIVFSIGAVADDFGNLKIFYGAADSCICIGTTTIDEIVTNCFESGDEY
ncbi:MAG: glycoside hydrolase family 130 protein [Phycisphaerales bacterium]|nr:MAG: glycoside hydrolase family 130 protein [Phycisphaerales bacterium]